MSDAMKKDLQDNGPHLDLLRIDAVRAGEATQEDAAHCSMCVECGNLLNGMGRLEASLKAVQPTVPETPGEFDRAMEQEFTNMFKPEQKDNVLQFPFWRRRLVAAASIAAAAAVVAAVSLPLLREEFSTADRPAMTGRIEQPLMKEKRAAASKDVRAETNGGFNAYAKADVNGDGAIDILDAFKLARTLEEKTPLAQGWDLNSDGVVNRADVDEAARMAVSLGG